MLRQHTANLVFIVAILAACAYFAWIAEGFVTSGLLGARGCLPSFSQLTLGITAIALIVGYQYISREDVGDEGQTVFENGTEARQGILMLAVAVVCYWV